MTDPVRPWPQPDELTRPFWASAADHRLVAPRCPACAAWQWPPAAVCSACGASGVPTWVELSGRARVYSWVVDHRNLLPGFSGTYVIGLVVPVEVDGDAVRLVTNLPGCSPGEIRIGMDVTVVWEELRPGVVVPQFSAVTEEANA